MLYFGRVGSSCGICAKVGSSCGICAKVGSSCGKKIITPKKYDVNHFLSMKVKESMI
jgi:hypothetical protein